MTYSMHQAFAPITKTMLTSLSEVLAKGAAFAEAKKIEPSVLLGWRLTPDMFPLTRQVQIATDGARGGAARLAGMEMPSVPDEEKTFDELHARIKSTIAYIDSIPAAKIDGSEGKTIVLKMRSGERTFTGQSFLMGFVLPNLMFHCTTAYNLLRMNGVEVGKRDFLGTFQG